MKKFHLSTIVLMLFASICYSQAAHRIFEFNLGDEYQKQTLLNSDCIIQRGSQQLEITSSTDVTKNYTVTGTNIGSYTLTAAIKNMDVVIDVKGRQLHYNSEKKIDTTSQIEKALQFMVAKPSAVSVNDHGIILSVRDSLLELVNDTLLRFVGVQPEPFYKGRILSFLADFTQRPGMGLKKGYTWIDSAALRRQNIITRFTIFDVTDSTTIIKFKSASAVESIKSNSNGTYIFDNRTGMVVYRLMKSVSIGYEISNGVIYATTRRTSLSETNVKKPGKKLPDDKSPGGVPYRDIVSHQ